MHMPIQFDTLDYAKRLASAGVPTQQAEAHATALGEVLGSAVVVHGELAALERNLLGEIKLVAQNVDTKLGALELKIDALELRLDTRIDALEHKFTTRLDALEQKFHTKLEALEQKLDARLERLDLRHGADMKHVYWMMSTLILLNLGILSKLMLQ
ncbi:hypothetical protein [Janthinobacterium lividum]|uniref:DUF1640 domain-containing protein n=1 Tax=Janthinobacterium lividum TaxID=29581 RepID=A0ABU0Y533_9BURK|nr:hypothetical protein [Janthinobacterium lividum]MDQ4629741.1 hypothetical protein [Janthinobacterium lividum]MDQ4677874.1 hypothetical protein [Janthinobacterium lividum]MDQ4688496.1 hypothetical protein [Janthinobacterium lividum]